MNKQFIKDGLVWGFVLWLIGYILGFIFFMFVPQNLIGWVIMPIGLIITLLVLFKKIQSKSLQYYFKIGIIWAIIAVVFDYLFIVKLLKPQDGYYKLDVYLYYLYAFLLPVLTGLRKSIVGKKT